MDIFLARAEVAKSSTTREGFLFLIDMGLSYYSAQYQLFQLAKTSVEEENWSALQTLVKRFSNTLKLGILPIPILGDDYYSTGSFSYYRELSFRLRKDYYLVAVDLLDPPLFWPLIIHEIAHCVLNETEYLKEICTSSEAWEIKTEAKVPLEERVEETLCDVIATRLFGPAYPWAYTTKLWLRFPKKVREDYPQHSFRLECMAEVLERSELVEAAESLRKLRDQRFDVSWQQEEIHPLKQSIMDASENFPTTANRELYNKSLFATEKLFVSPPKDPVLLYLTCWNVFLEKGPLETETILPRLSSIILSTLKR